MTKTSRRPRRERVPAGKRSGGNLGMRSGGRGWVIAWVLLVVVAVGGLYLLYTSSGPSGSGSSTTTSDASGYSHVAGEPGAGEMAPDFTLPASTGGEVSLSDYRGRSVLLYFQEGLMCQPCWDQIRDLEQNEAALTAAGIDEIVSITTDPVDLVARKMADEGLATPVLSDPSLQVSRAYTTNEYGMMGTSRNGHSFILVGPDGQIAWRADYGGAPDYVMYLPTESMLADLEREQAR
ncbi:peroxiredoxin family protein [Pseudonocardia sp. MH-G8]|uniref:peroxiredoxin family protein n=1 Tax=Pseudonocardia sp. MH-G8 TaxID=1854588 RepID=UPI000BA082D8|nr:peroxiredoxin family protein [Pseudonocardia sp. MH-G8]OZM76377.1 alkyl hydroperoxide reductase [Pseudonocardia sp. MH-G8]